MNPPTLQFAFGILQSEDYLLMEETIEYKTLLEKYINNECSPEEFHLLMDFLQKNESSRLLLGQLKKEFQIKEAKPGQMSSKQREQVLNNLLQKLQPVRQAPVVFIRGRIRNIAVAAAIVIILGMSSYLLSVNSEKPISATVQREAKSKYKSDVLPGSNKATLTLADGRVLELDDANNGTLAQQGNTRIIKIGSRLAYNTGATNSKEILYNTITTPRGGQYQIELPDGSLVWLNSASSLRFPTLFSGKQRRVTMTGEGYFEIAKNAAMSFIVSVNGTEINVLGTHFNVMAYQDEPGIKTTLLEGAVKLSNGVSKCLLKPGQQSQLFKEGDFKIQEANIAEAIAWKDGRFHFEKSEIGNVMSQLARWYDVEVVYKRKINTRFYLQMSRNTKLSEILKVLELTGNIKFEINGKKIIVS